MNKQALITALLLTATALPVTAAENDFWTQLPLNTCAVDQFLQQYPQHDGRGVVIAILDTGVDPSIPGLTQTPDGQTKVIDVQDFTGEGDVDLHRVNVDEQGAVVNYDDDGAPIQFAIPKLATSSEKRNFLFGWFDESKFVNSDAPDINDNGKTDDRFAVLVTALDQDGDDQALCYIDTNMDRSFADEKPLRNYKLDYDTFTLARRKPESQIEPMTFSVNIFLRQQKVTVCFDDGAHGTHVAGIAAGYRINNQDGLNGVAPGAKVIGLKIGNGEFGGISTTDAKKEAMEYAARFAQENNVPVICNLSFGVDSTIEGNSDIDKFMEEHLRKHPYLVLCSSAGNDGPGLSSVGTPAAADQVISVAALQAASAGRDVRGFEMDGPVVTPFSSRGGEIAKPDIATPGWCTSTVPRFVTDGDYWPGTSMASPHATGLCALLVSHVLADNPKVKVRNRDIKQALASSAKPIPDFTNLDYGFGIPQMPEAAKVISELAGKTESDPVIGYEISTACPHGYKGRSQAAYWRSTYFPSDEPQTFTITPVFAPTADAKVRTGFTRKFALRSNAPWCSINQESVYLRSEQEAQVYVTYDKSQLTEPGLYTGSVDLIYDGMIATRLMSTIIVPHQVNAQSNYTLQLTDQKVEGWHPQRHYLAVPPGAGACRLKLTAPQGEKSEAVMQRVFDPHGYQFRKRGNRLNTESGKKEITWTLDDELIPGVWEVTIESARPDREWPYNLEARFFGLHAEPAEINSWKASSSKAPSGKLTVTNVFPMPLLAKASGRVEGFRKVKKDHFEGLNDEVTLPIKLGADYSALRLHLEMTEKAWAETTDIAVIINQDGEPVYSSAFSNNTFDATIGHPAPGEDVSLELVIHAGFAISDDERETPITIHADHMLANPIDINVTRDKVSSVNLVPGVPIEMQYKAEETLPKKPDGTHPVGYLRFIESGSNETALKVLLDITD